MPPALRDLTLVFPKIALRRACGIVGPIRVSCSVRNGGHSIGLRCHRTDCLTALTQRVKKPAIAVEEITFGRGWETAMGFEAGSIQFEEVGYAPGMYPVPQDPVSDITKDPSIWRTRTAIFIAAA